MNPAKLADIAASVDIEKDRTQERIGLWPLAAYFLRLGTTGFGGR